MSGIRREGTILSQSKDRDGTRREASDRSLFDPHGGAGASTGLSTSWHLPRDLRLQATRRLRVIALLYALAFFLADFGPPLFLGSIREKFQDPIDWAATAASIVAGLVVAALVASPRLSWETKVNLGLVFEVAARAVLRRRPSGRWRRRARGRGGLLPRRGRAGRRGSVGRRPD